MKETRFMQEVIETYRTKIEGLPSNIKPKAEYFLRCFISNEKEIFHTANLNLLSQLCHNRNVLMLKLEILLSKWAN